MSRRKRANPGSARRGAREAGMRMTDQIRAILADRAERVGRAAVAEALGVTKSTLSRVLAGQIWVSRSTLDRAGEYLGVTVYYSAQVSRR